MFVTYEMFVTHVRNVLKLFSNQLLHSKMLSTHSNHSRDSKFQIKVFVLKTCLFLVTCGPEISPWMSPRNINLDTKRFKISWTKISHFDPCPIIYTV